MEITLFDYENLVETSIYEHDSYLFIYLLEELPLHERLVYNKNFIKLI